RRGLAAAGPHGTRARDPGRRRARRLRRRDLPGDAAALRIQRGGRRRSRPRPPAGTGDAALGRRPRPARRLEPRRGDPPRRIPVRKRRIRAFSLLRPLLRRPARLRGPGPRALLPRRELPGGGRPRRLYRLPVPPGEERRGRRAAPRGGDRAPGGGPMRDPGLTPFLLLPAIDLRGGQAVRLRQGEARRRARYSDDPVRVARQFAEAGARALHVVYLDGAFSGAPVNLPLVARICRVAGVPVRLGGGLRRHEDMEAAFSAGVSVVILGTSALEDPASVAGA